jgi:hypothetical protein
LPHAGTERYMINAMKTPYTLHIVAIDPRQPGAESTYRVMRHETKGPGDAMPRTPPNLWSGLRHALGRVGCNVATIAALKIDLDKKRSADIPEMLLDDANLRTIGFTDV